MEKCPVCKTKLKLTPLLRLKFFKPRPCPNCGVMIYRRRWPWFLFYAGVALSVCGNFLLNVQMSDWAREWARDLGRDAFFTLIVVWHAVSLTMIVTGGVLGRRYRIAKEQ